MDNSWPQIPCRVHCIAGSSAKGHAQSHDQPGYREGTEASCGDCSAGDAGGIALSPESQNDEYKHAGGDELAEEIDTLVLNGRHCAEQAEKSVRIVRSGLEMVLIEYIYQQCPAESSEHLCHGVRQKLRPGELARDGESETHCRIEMCT